MWSYDIGDDYYKIIFKLIVNAKKKFKTNNAYI